MARRTSEEVAKDVVLVSRILHSLETNPAAVEKALDLLYANQTSDEKVSSTTHHDNLRGFSQAHAHLGTWLVTVVIANGRAQGRPAGSLLRGKALALGRSIVTHYARTQLLRAAKEKASLQVQTQEAA